MVSIETKGQKTCFRVCNHSRREVTERLKRPKGKKEKERPGEAKEGFTPIGGKRGTGSPEMKTKTSHTEINFTRKSQL